MHTEHQQIEINAALGQSRLTLRRDGAGEVIGVKITTADYNVTTVVNAPDFLAAARVLCETDSPLKAGATLRRVLDQVAVERVRQNALFDAGKIPWNCADPMVT